jgi:hypothetical protein
MTINKAKRSIFEKESDQSSPFISNFPRETKFYLWSSNFSQLFAYLSGGKKGDTYSN